MIIIAIDPGASGGIAWHDTVEKTTRVAKMPATLVDQKIALDEISRNDYTEVWIEEVGQHVQGNNASASVKFAAHCGELRGIIVTLGLKMHRPRPLAWQKIVPNLPKRPPAPKRSDYHIMPSAYEEAKKAHREALRKHKHARKTRIKAWVQELNPAIRVTDHTADALGILEYALDQEKTNRRRNAHEVAKTLQVSRNKQEVE